MAPICSVVNPRSADQNGVSRPNLPESIHTTKFTKTTVTRTSRRLLVSLIMGVVPVEVLIHILHWMLRPLSASHAARMVGRPTGRSIAAILPMTSELVNNLFVIRVTRRVPPLRLTVMPIFLDSFRARRPQLTQPDRGVG